MSSDVVFYRQQAEKAVAKLFGDVPCNLGRVLIRLDELIGDSDPLRTVALPRVGDLLERKQNEIPNAVDRAISEAAFSLLMAELVERIEFAADQRGGKR